MSGTNSSGSEEKPGKALVAPGDSAGGLNIRFPKRMESDINIRISSTERERNYGLSLGQPLGLHGLSYTSIKLSRIIPGLSIVHTCVQVAEEKKNGVFIVVRSMEAAPSQCTRRQRKAPTLFLLPTRKRSSLSAFLKSSLGFLILRFSFEFSQATIASNGRPSNRTVVFRSSSSSCWYLELLLPALYVSSSRV